MNLTPLERFYLTVIRRNQKTPLLQVKKEVTLGRLRMVFDWRSPKNLWGRFGGGWNWKLGIQCGGATVIINLLIFSLYFEWTEES